VTGFLAGIPGGLPRQTGLESGDLNEVFTGRIDDIWMPSLPSTYSRCAPAETLLQGSTMGTNYSVKVVDLPSWLSAESLQAEIDRVLEAVNDSMSTYREDSELSRFNRNQGNDWVPASRELLQVLEAAQETSQLSGGAFDVTVGPLVNLWGFGPGAGGDRVPDDDEIQQAQARVGYQRLHLRSDPPALKKDLPDLYLDLSAIAKGYGVDAVTAYLKSLGLQNFLVETQKT